ncbi:sodium:solute symporter family protein [Xanthobacteraceae bacterium Astr-EGSB]|uniref:sodium:solute symporter family protein n=1 Tax=Astrobacterium formosum TaxID=3069710 RepID=UPI0027B10206|nr:sodium:solute symporter family protein [Xanthobacteraceae bacterium Astr-EGSB]
MAFISFSVAASLTLTVIAIFAAGAWSGRNVDSAEEFSLSGRSAGTALIAGSMLGTCVGGASTVGTAQMASALGLSAWWFTIGMGSGLLVLALFYARALRGTGFETISQYLAAHYGPVAGTLTSVITALSMLFSAVASVLAGIHVIAMVTGGTPWMAAVAIVVLVVCYVVFGGMKAAGISGLVKMAVIWVTLCTAGVTATLSLADLPGFDQAFPAFPWFSLAARGFDDCVGNFVSVVVGIVCSQSYVQVIYSASDARTATVGTVVAALITIPVGLPLIAVGMFMHAQHPDLTPVLALPVYFVTYLPAWIAGMGLAGILISVVSSTAGLSLSVGTLLANDFGREYLHISERHVLMVTRICVAAFAALSAAIALTHLDSFLLDWNYMSLALRGAGIFLPLTLTILWPRRLSPAWAVASMAASTSLAVFGRTVFSIPINPLFTGMALSAILVTIGLMVGKPAPRLAPEASGRPPR